MSKAKKSICVILAVLIVCLSVIIFLKGNSADKIPPEISFDKDTIKVSVSDGNRKLLEGVKADDNVDGDITKEMVIDSVSDFNKDGSRIITYASTDSSDNVSKKSRKMFYSDYRSPEFSLTASPVFSAGDANINIADILQASDVFDGDITSFIKLKEDNIRVGQGGTYYALVTVYNSAGDKSELKLPVFIEAMRTGNDPKVNLTNYMVYLDKGEKKPNWRKYIESVQNCSNKSETNSDATTLRKIRIDDSNVNTAKEGCYYVSYEYTNPDNVTSVTRLIVSVR